MRIFNGRGARNQPRGGNGNFNRQNSMRGNNSNRMGRRNGRNGHNNRSNRNDRNDQLKTNDQLDNELDAYFNKVWDANPV